VSVAGAPNWIAPEVLKNKSCTDKYDVWSLGCCMLEMLTGNPPWHELGQDEKVIIDHIANTKKPPLVPNNLSKECSDFLKYCFELNPDHRPTCDEFVDHPFITKKYIKGNSSSNHLDTTRSLESSVGLGSLQGSFISGGVSSIAGNPNSWNVVGNSFISGQNSINGTKSLLALTGQQGEPPALHP